VFFFLSVLGRSYGNFLSSDFIHFYPSDAIFFTDSSGSIKFNPI